MYIESVQLKNFRNYDSLELDLAQGTNIFYIKFQIPLFFKKKLKFFYIFFKKVLTLAFTFDIVSLVARESKRIPKKCDMRKCRNWQTSKTKDLVSIALVWVQVPSSA